MITYSKKLAQLEKRNAKIAKRLAKGEKAKDIGLDYGMSRQRVEAICKMINKMNTAQ